MKATKVLLVISGLIALGIGLAMLFAAPAFLASQGFAADDKTAVIGRAQGSLLLGIGVLNLLAARLGDPRGLQAICAANLATHVAALGVNVHALVAGLVGSSVVGDAVGHVVFGLAFGSCIALLGRRGQAAAGASR
jgi:hypothetical protein